MPDISTLVDDIYRLFDPSNDHEVSEENLSVFTETLKQILRTRLGKQETATDPLRFSALGSCERKLWYSSRNEDKEGMSPQTYFKFLYGDVIEALVLFLAKESGHEVSDEQKEVEVLGVKGHIDCVIDGVVVDVKSASPIGYKKFEAGTIFEDDPFGYIPQISGYANVLDRSCAFLAFDKVSGEITLTPVPPAVVEEFKPQQRIEHLVSVIGNPIPPSRPFQDKEDGKSGNRKLGTECSYCSFKNSCWPGLRTFLYSTGPRFLTEVKREPDVYEVKNES